MRLSLIHLRSTTANFTEAYLVELMLLPWLDVHVFNVIAVPVPVPAVAAISWT